MKEILAKRKILITCGTGGVGKTTLSASMAIRAALAGLRTCVITIDPAKRLATSLGMQSLGDTPQNLTDPLREALRLQQLELPAGAGLWALMPDTRHTIESFFRGISGNPELAERIIKNPLVQIFAREFSGTNEYMAMQKLQALHESGQFDCIILDTPPSRSTLEFLDAPRLLSQLFEANFIQWLVVPANKLASVAMKKALGLLEKLTGAGFMGHMLDFVAALFEMRTGFSDHLRRMIRLLESEQVGVILVTGPNTDFTAELTHFRGHLEKHGLRLDGMVVNRTLGAYPSEPSSEVRDIEPAIQLLQALQSREKRALERLSSAPISRGIPRHEMPELARDIHSLPDLVQIARRLP